MTSKFRLILALGMLCGVAQAQSHRFPPIDTYSGDPTGVACSITNSIVQSTTTGTLYSCIGGVYVKPTGTGGIPGGSPAQIQYNNSGAFGGSAATLDGAGNFNTPATVTVGKAVLTNGEYSNGTCTTAATVDPANGNRQTVTLTTGNICVLSFVQPASGTANLQLKVRQSSVNPYSGGIAGGLWSAGGIPQITQSLAATDFVNCYLDGTSAFCSVAQNMQAGYVAPPALSPVAGTYRPNQVVTAATTTSACNTAPSLYVGPTNPPTSNGGTYTLTTSTTLYAYAHNCAGYADSAITSAAYTVTNAPAVTHTASCSLMTPSSVSTAACTLTGVQAGDAIIVTSAAPTVTVLSVVDSAGGTSTAAKGGSDSGPGTTKFYTYYIPNAAAGSHTITVTFSANVTFGAIIADSFSGASVTTPIVSFPTGTSGTLAGANPVGPSVTPVWTLDIIYGIFDIPSVSTTPGMTSAGYTFAYGNQTGFGTNYGWGSYWANPASGAATQVTLSPTISGTYGITSMVIH